MVQDEVLQSEMAFLVSDPGLTTLLDQQRLLLWYDMNEREGDKVCHISMLN